MTQDIPDTLLDERELARQPAPAPGARLTTWRAFLTRAPAPPANLSVSPPGFSNVRLTSDLAEHAIQTLMHGRSRRRRRSAAPNILALSGGGSGGAFGAGIIVGLSRSGTRPAFEVVTGVSTGALIAPLAFLGSGWDERLVEAFTGGGAADLLNLRTIYRGDGLDVLVGRFVDTALLETVAREHRKGRRLFVATTNLDTQQSVVWDMGAIAAQGGERAVALFHDVLVASASLPGLFPPKMIVVETGAGRYEEMHVDGGASTPLFIVPDSILLSRRVGDLLSGAKVYAIVNTGLDPAPQTVSTNRLAIMVRSFETMLRFSYRHAVEAAAAFCENNRLSLSICAPPTDLQDDGFIRFDTNAMRATFDAAVERAQAGLAWTPAFRTG